MVNCRKVLARYKLVWGLHKMRVSCMIVMEGVDCMKEMDSCKQVTWCSRVLELHKRGTSHMKLMVVESCKKLGGAIDG